MNLRAMREAAGLTQQELANRLQARADQRDAAARGQRGQDEGQVKGASDSWDQSKVSRYEAHPELAPMGQVMAMMEVLGGHSIPIPQPELVGVDAGAPYGGVLAQLEAIERFIADNGFGTADPDDVLALRGLTTRLRDKPRVALLGKFDAGKTTIINTLLGRRHMPTAYQPATWLPTYLRHTEDRPGFMDQKHDVLLMGPDFDPSRWRDAEHVRLHTRAAGTLDLLQRPEEPESSLPDHPDVSSVGAGPVRASGDEVVALAYVDAPVLRSCTLIDMPGFGESEDQDPQVSILAFDAAIFAESVTGFLDGMSLELISEAVRRLSQTTPTGKPDQALKRLIIAATHAHAGVSDEAIDGQILAGGAARLARQLSALGETEVQADDLRKQMVAFEPSHAQRVEPLLQLVEALLSTTLPEPTLSSLGSAIAAEGDELRTRWSDQLAAALEASTNADELGARATRLEREREEHFADVQKAAEKARGAIEEHARDSIGSIRSILASYDQDHVQAIIERDFKDKKDALRNAGAFFSTRIRSQVEAELKRRTDLLDEDLHTFVEACEASLNTGTGFDGRLRSKADPRTRFLGGLGGGAVGAAGVGALAAYAATLGNLGAYILVAQGVGVLSGLGISVGGGAAGVAAVAAIGGPVTIGVGLVVLAGVGGAALARGPWPKQLARQIVKKVVQPLQLGTPAQADRPAIPALHQALAEFWKELMAQFDRGVAGVKDAYDEQIKDLRAHAGDPAYHRARATQLKAMLAALDDLFPQTPGQDRSTDKGGN